MSGKTEKFTIVSDQGGSPELLAACTVAAMWLYGHQTDLSAVYLG
jgi:hypothetical protein